MPAPGETRPDNGLLAIPLAGRRQRRERADSQRNRRRLLDAAEQIIEAHGVEELTMGELARAAGVGVGTLYRHFGDRAGLLNALLDVREEELQAGFLQGPPPLGPGAPAAERITAFLGACVDYLEQHTALTLACEAADPAMRMHAASYTTRRTHLAILIREANPAADATYLAAALLEPLAAHTYAHQRHVLGMPVDRIKAGLTALAGAVT